MWPTYKDIEYFYKAFCYTDEDIADFTSWGVLTPEEYERMTGKPYTQGTDWFQCLFYINKLQRVGVVWKRCPCQK